jgi:hypothetical protein
MINDVIFVTAFGRGSWLKNELERLQWTTSVLDVSHLFGEMDRAEVEGPFGLFAASDLKDSQAFHFKSQIGYQVAIPQTGFVLWTGQGPLEFKSPLSTSQFSSFGIPQTVIQYLKSSETDNSNTARERRTVGKYVFSENRLAQFAHDFASPEISSSDLAIKRGAASPLLADYSLRLQVGGKAKSLGAGLRPSELLEEGRIFSGLKVQDAKGATSVLQGRTLVWCLNALETQNLLGEFSALFFKGDVIRPDYVWFRFKMSNSLFGESQAVANQIPASMVIVEDLDLPWEQSNSFVMRASSEPGNFDIWTKLPQWIKGDQKALEKMSISLAAVLNRRFPIGMKAVVSVPPQAAHSKTEIGLWPIYESENRQKIKTVGRKRIYFHSNDQWEGLDPLNQYRHESRILGPVVNVLNRLKLEREALERKRQIKELKEIRRQANRKSP